MPTVQKYGPRRVQPAGLPQARLTTPSETEVSAGGAVARAQGRAAGRIAESVEALAAPLFSISVEESARLKAEEQRTANETALLKASNQIAAWTAKRLYDPDTGAFAQRGEAALPLPEQIHAEYDQVTSAIAATMKGPEQELAFAKVQAREWESINLQVRRHVFGEQQAYQEGQLTAYVANKSNDAVKNALDPKVVAMNLQDAITAVKTHAPKLGKSPEAIEQSVRAIESNVHVGVINQLLTLEKTPQAEQYFTLTREGIAADQVDDVQRALEEGTLRRQAQQQTDRILSEGGTLTEQLNKAKSFEPKLRDEVSQRLEHQAVLTEREEREADEHTLRGAYDVVERTHDVQAIPPGVWKDFDGPQRAALRNYAEALTAGIPVKTDLPTYYRYMNQAASNPQGFATANLLKDRHRLGESDFQELSRLQFAIKTGKTPEALAGFRTKTQIIDDTLALYGIDPNAKPETAEGKAIAQLRQMVDRRIEAAQSTGQKVTNTEVQETVDTLLGQSITVPGSWWNIFPGGKPFWDQQKRLLDVAITDLTAEQRATYEQVLRDAGRPVSDAAILDLHLETEMRRRAKTTPSR